MSNAEVKVNVSPDDKEWTLEVSYDEEASDGDFCETLAIVLLQFCRMASLSAADLVKEAELLESESLATKENLN